MDSMGSMTMAMPPTSTVSGVMSTSSSSMSGMPVMSGMPGMEGIDMSCKISVSEGKRHIETRADNEADAMELGHDRCLYEVSVL